MKSAMKRCACQRRVACRFRRSHPTPSARTIHAPFPLLPAHPQREPARGGDRLAPADAARRHDPPAGGRASIPGCRSASACSTRSCQIVREEQDRAGAIEILMPTHPVGRPLARERPLRRLRQGDAAHRGPARARHALRPDQRGDDHRHLPRLRQVLQGPAAQPLPHPVEVPRRGAPALRRHARPRIPDEGRLFLRPRRRGRARPPTTGCSSPICAPSRAWA